MKFLTKKEEKEPKKTVKTTAKEKVAKPTKEAEKEVKEPKKEKTAKEPQKTAVKEEKKEHMPVSHKKKEGSKGAFEWVEYKPKEIEEVIINLANTGHSPAQIGMVLRDQYGIPNTKTFLGKKVEEFLGENNLLHEVPFELLSLIKKSVKIENHLKENKKDMTAKRGFTLTVSKIRRLVRYYHKKGKLSKDWKYTSERAALLIK